MENGFYVSRIQHASTKSKNLHKKTCYYGMMIYNKHIAIKRSFYYTIYNKHIIYILQVNGVFII